MDFMKLFKSLEELLYEVIVMLVFFPKTLWLTLRYPQRMMDYADTELGDVQSEQYNDTLSPPLFLMLCVGLSHLVERAVPGTLVEATLPNLLRDSQNLLAFRVLTFSLLPLAFSLRLLHGLGLPLDRETLRAPFFAQCFIAAPMAMAMGLAQPLEHLPIPYAGSIAGSVYVISLGWYLLQQAHWLRSKLGLPAWRCWAATILIALVTMFTLILTGILLVVLNP